MLKIASALNIAGVSHDAQTNRKGAKLPTNKDERKRPLHDASEQPLLVPPKKEPCTG